MKPIHAAIREIQHAECCDSWWALFIDFDDPGEFTSKQIITQTDITDASNIKHAVLLRDAYRIIGITPASPATRLESFTCI